MALGITKETAAGVQTGYTKWELAYINNGAPCRVLFKDYIDEPARAAGKVAVRDGEKDITLTAEEQATISGILYAAMKRTDEYSTATDIDPDEWKQPVVEE